MYPKTAINRTDLIFNPYTAAACVVSHEVISGTFFLKKTPSDERLILKAIILQKQSVSHL